MACCGGGTAAAAASEAYLESDAVREARELVAELCRHFYAQGWVTGTGGSITVKANDPALPLAERLIVMSPSGVQKERMVPEDMYVMSADGKVLSSPVSKPWPYKPPKCTDCAPLFMKITHMEMIKGIKGHGYHDELVIPIIENTPYEYELTDSLAEAIAAYPKATAVLVRNHGIYVWGDSWINAKTQAECYHYLFDAAIRLYQLGIDWTTSEHGPINNAKRPRSIVSPDIPNGCHAAKPSKHFVVLDIEGTTTPISFVTDVMFPYARDNVRKHLTSTYDSDETKEDIKLLRIQVEEDLKNGIVGSVPIPPDDASKEEVINSLVANVESMIKADRKITSLKQLQGHIWRTGFESKELQGVVFEDVPEVLKHWHASGTKVYIYSSGSREAQRLLFGNTTYGDLRKYLYGFFDTTTGHTFPFLLKASARLPLRASEQLHALAVKHGLEHDAYVANGLVRAYSVAGLVPVARRVFDELPERSAVVYTTMVSGYGQNGMHDEAMWVFEEMIRDGFEPGGAALASVLSACARSGSHGLEMGRRVHDLMEAKGMTAPVGVILGTALVDMYAKTGAMEEAMVVFEEMPERHTATWNALITGLAHHGHGEGALATFHRMRREGVRPNATTLVGVLSAYCHAGRLDEARRVFVSMEKDFAVAPTIQHYSCMVDLLGRSGLLVEAEEMIRGMTTCDADTVIWGALLTACKYHGDIEVAERAVQEMLKLDPSNHGVYVVLSNMYAEAGRWQDVDRLRQVMKRARLSKVPGSSAVAGDG
ncbi:hypothetical protein ABZP36_009927 [Zizania latifolia]